MANSHPTSRENRGSQPVNNYCPSGPVNRLPSRRTLCTDIRWLPELNADLIVNGQISIVRNRRSQGRVFFYFVPIPTVANLWLGYEVLHTEERLEHATVHDCFLVKKEDDDSGVQRYFHYPAWDLRVFTRG